MSRFWCFSQSSKKKCKSLSKKMEITNVMEYQEIAKQKLPKMVYDYYASGAEDQWTLHENRNAFSRIQWAYLSLFYCYLPSFWLQLMIISVIWLYRFRPRILIDVSKIDMTTTVLGFKISMPIMIAPSAMQKMAHPDGIYWLVSCVSWVLPGLLCMWLCGIKN